MSAEGPLPYFESSPFHIAGKEYSAQQVIDTLGPQLTEHRRTRMQQVVENRTFNVAPVLENIYDRGNVSAVMRSAEAFGFMNFHVIEKPDAKFKAANRVTQGSDKWLHIQRHSSTGECVKSLRAQGFQIFATHLEATHTLEEIDLTQPTALVLGNEREGVSDEMLEGCDGRVILPMYGFAQSFNISVAAALCFFDIFQKRKEAKDLGGDLTADEKNCVLANYILRSHDHPRKLLEQLIGK